MKVDSKLVKAAIEFVKTRFPSGIEGAAAMKKDFTSLLRAEFVRKDFGFMVVM